MGESFLYVALADHRNLNGIYTEFIELLRKKSLEEIFFKMLLTQEMNHRNLNGIYTDFFLVASLDVLEQRRQSESALSLC